SDLESYIVSRIDYLKSRALFQYLYEGWVKDETVDGKLTEKGLKYSEMIKNPKMSYKEYLEWKKTDKARLEWENRMSNRSLLVILKDKNNITDDERQDIKDKKDDDVNGKFNKKLKIKEDENKISYTISKDN